MMIRKVYLVILCLCVLGLPVVAQTIRPWERNGMRDTYKLFVRHTWNVTDAVDETSGYSRRQYVYSDSMYIPQTLDGKRFTLSVGAADQEAWVYVNGNSVGYHGILPAIAMWVR